jgi:hypothetical protein
MNKTKVNWFGLIRRLTMIAAALSVLTGATLANPRSTHRHKPAVAFYKQSTDSGRSSVNLKNRQAIENDSVGYELPDRPGFDPYLR